MNNPRRIGKRVFVTGGARSGKSLFAESYAAHLGAHGIYVATAQPFDHEMRDRICRHQQQREESGFAWETVEEPYELTALLGRLDRQSANEKGDPELVVLVDCLTLWLTNWMLTGEDAQASLEARTKIEELTEAIQRFRGHLLLVSNEVGSGIVPEYPLGRQFRDLAGIMNRLVAAVCDEAVLVTAGIPIELKSLAFHIPGGRFL